MCCFSACLHHHVSHHHEATQRKDNHLVTQRRCAYNDNFGVVTEQRCYLLAENHKNDGPGQKKRETDLGAKPKTFFRPIVELGTITETTHGLKTLV